MYTVTETRRPAFGQPDQQALSFSLVKEYSPEKPLLFGILTHYHFHVREDLADAILLTFKRYSLPTCLDNLRIWHEQALESEYSVYSEPERRGAIDSFYKAMEKLLEAMYLLYAPRDLQYSMNEDGEKKIQCSTPWVPGKPLVLSRKEFENPQSVLSGFCRKFGWPYVKMEMWDWLQAAMTNESETNLMAENRWCLMEFYAHVHYMVEASYLLTPSLDYYN